MLPRHLIVCISLLFSLLIAPPVSAQTTNKSAPGISEKGSLYVTNNFDRTISVISIANYHVTQTIRVLASDVSRVSATLHLGSISDSTNNMSLSPDGNTLNVNVNGFERDQNTPAQGTPAVIEISTATNTIKTTVSDLIAVIKTFGMPVPVRAPFGIASSSVRSPDGTKLYITDIFNEYHSKDGDKENNMNVVWEIPIPQASPSGVTSTLGNGGGLNSQNNLKLVPVGQGPFVHGMPVPKDVKVFPVGHNPEAIAISPDGNKIFVTNAVDNTVSVIDTAKDAVISTIPVGTWPKGLAVSPDGTAVYVVNHGNGDNNFSGSVSVISAATNKVVATVPVGRGPVGIVVSNNPPVQMDKPMPGDIVVYRDEAGSIIHTGVVIKGRTLTNGKIIPDGVLADGTVTLIESKWESMGRYIHDPNDSIYGPNWTVWRARRKDGSHNNALIKGRLSNGSLFAITYYTDRVAANKDGSIDLNDWVADSVLGWFGGWTDEETQDKVNMYIIIAHPFLHNRIMRPSVHWQEYKWYPALLKLASTNRGKERYFTFEETEKPTPNYNCHGFTFTNGKIYVAPKFAQRIINDDGYYQIKDARDTDRKVH